MTRESDPRSTQDSSSNELASNAVLYPTESTQTSPGHKNGIIRLNDPMKPNPMPETIGFERNILGVPMCVLNPKAARSIAKLYYTWPLKGGRFASYTFMRPSDGAFPLTQHALYLDCLLASFAANFRDDGILYYRRSDILRLAGKAPNNAGARASLDEAVLRFRRCNMEWKLAWVGSTEDWSGPIIVYSNLFDDLETPRNPRNFHSPVGEGKNRKEQEKWHSVKFNEVVVKALADSRTRIFLTEILRSGISHDAFCVYRYFYGFSDTTEITRSYEQLRFVFPWTGQKNRFTGWLNKKLEELCTMGLLAYYKPIANSVIVKCHNIKDLKKSLKGKDPIILTGKTRVDEGLKPARDNCQRNYIAPSSPTKNTTEKTQPAKTKIIKATKLKLADDTLLQHYFDLKAAGKVSEHVAETIDLCLAKGSREVYLPAIRNYIDRMG